MSTLMKIADGPCTMSQLARHQAVSLPTVSRSVDMLVRLTPDGREALASVRRRAEAHIQNKLLTLTADERLQMVAASQLLTNIFSTPGDDRS
jgi:DNA-binding MarR family transcriptional regulator